jgi:hypothetical protein
MRDEQQGDQQDGLSKGTDLPEGRMAGAPAGAWQNARRETNQGAVARPGGATQNSGGARLGNEEEAGWGPARGAD